ncbi:L,D-transpeptidase [Desulfolutivibrio sulfoxidireducens]|uniref:L,D-transpeptidase n=1 Tax=Desulfolutivibrio sulfoxidireducens TaxID=2773299 RepID=UPI001C406E50|nr:L,D-transpeptidase [Desulfolutivibrio sulfoxidireducens]
MKRTWRVPVVLFVVFAVFFSSEAKARDAVGERPAVTVPTASEGEAPASEEGLGERLEAVRLQGLCLLASPRAGAATRKVLRAGEVVRVVAVTGDWVEIAVRGDVSGFVQRGYLTGFSGDVPPPYRDRLARLSRRPGKGDTVGSLVAVGPAIPATQGTAAGPNEPASGRDQADVADEPRPSAGHIAPFVSEKPATTPESAARSASGLRDLGPRAEAGTFPFPDPQGIERYLATVLADLRRPSVRASTDRLDATGRAYYERKNRYAIEVFLSECKLVLYEKQADGGRHPMRTFVVATPANDVEPPQGWGVITQIEFEPWWRPTENMKRRARQKGRSLPDVVPPGAKNPMGPFKMHLSHGFAFRIHGNNDPKSIGRRVTNGCIRMRNDEGVELAKILDVGTEVVFSEHAPSSAENQRPGP